MTNKTSTSIEQDPRWQAIVKRDAAFDEAFVYAVKTTGIYCRPSSASRRPKPENVLFFASAEEAEAQGFRPSKRARQDQGSTLSRHVELIAAACRTIEQAETEPSLDDLATSASLSPFHFHRIFKTISGMTPKKYAQAHRAQKISNRLQNDDSVTHAIYESGFNSSSRFYEASQKILGWYESFRLQKRRQ